ncbi:M23 family metallopeptidase [Sulfurospirillum arcachonense]|uniref:M23 family metallopeptidase n=1 Tax=Sulfurospirillum arcachonense TaxID=57666 RepID=UPI00046AB4FC|nr:M23 family metallopeptidase [Sulfurospirillum arcachonense]
MRDKFTITITDVNGSKHYLLNQIIKRFVLYFTLFIIFLIAAGSYLINFLIDQVDDLEHKKEKIVNEQVILKNKNDKLLAEIKVKNEEYNTIKESITDMEALVGITPSLETEVDVRLQNIKFTSAQQKVFFNNIPNGPVVASNGYSGKFGWRTHPILKRKEFHRGLDLRAKKMTPVHAPADGVVEYAGYHKSSGFGNLVIIDHNYGFKTTYAHLSKKFPVKSGTFVKKGDIIAYTGNSGLSTGPHLHYEVRFITRPLNPENFTKWNSSNFEKIFKKEKRVSWQSLIKLMQNHLRLPKPQS